MVKNEAFLQVLRRVQEKFAGRSISARELLQEFEVDWPKSLWFEGKPSLDLVLGWLGSRNFYTDPRAQRHETDPPKGAILGDRCHPLSVMHLRIL